MHKYAQHVFLFFLSCLLASASIAGAKKRERSHLGDTIASFTLTATNGNLYSLNDYPNAKGFMVVFTCNHCPFAKLYTDRLNQLSTKYAPLGVPLVAINSMDSLIYEEENYGQMKAWAEHEEWTFPYLQDGKQVVGQVFGADHTPDAFVLWKEQGKWIIRYTGAIDDNGAEPNKIQHTYITEAVDELLEGKKVSRPETDSFGCAIFYRKN